MKKQIAYISAWLAAYFVAWCLGFSVGYKIWLVVVTYIAAKAGAFAILGAKPD